MGIPDVRARKGLVHGGDVEGAVSWIAEHQDDPDIDQEYLVRRKDTVPKVLTANAIVCCIMLWLLISVASL